MKWTIAYKIGPVAKTERTVDVYSRTERAAGFAFQNSNPRAIITSIEPARKTVEVGYEPDAENETARVERANSFFESVWAV